VGNALRDRPGLQNRFGRFTEANIGQRLAIALDGQIKSAPVINARIEDQA